MLKTINTIVENTPDYYDLYVRKNVRVYYGSRQIEYPETLLRNSADSGSKRTPHVSHTRRGIGQKIMIHMRTLKPRGLRGLF